LSNRLAGLEDASSPGLERAGEEASSHARPARGGERGRRGSARAGAEIRGGVLAMLARLRLATPEQLRAMLLPHQQGTDYVRRALRWTATRAVSPCGR
jgi:hypothetical protein